MNDEAKLQNGVKFSITATFGSAFHSGPHGIYWGTSGIWIPYILPAYLDNSLTCIQYSYICLGPIFQCEFNHDVNLVIRLTKFGNLGNWYTCICIQHQFSMRIQPQW